MDNFNLMQHPHLLRRRNISSLYINHHNLRVFMYSVKAIFCHIFMNDKNDRLVL